MLTSFRILGALKVYVAVGVMIPSLIGLSSPSAHTPERVGYVVLLLVALLGLMDAVINDVLPEGYEAPKVAMYRYLIFIFLAGGQLSVLHAELLTMADMSAIARYALDCAAATLVAVLDYQLRHQNAEELQTSRVPAHTA